MRVLISIRQAFSEARNNVKSVLKQTASAHSRLLYFQQTIELLGFNTQIMMTLNLEQTYWRTFLASAFLFPGVKEFIIDIKGKGIKTAIITDLTAQIQFRKIIYFGLDRYFDYIVTSEEAGTDKPDKAAFDMVLSKLKENPKDTWMIGDHPVNDIEGAKQLGMFTLQKKHKGVELSKNSPPHHVFEEYTTLRKEIKWLD